MVEDEKTSNIHHLSFEEYSRVESEIRSNLRYVWQKTASYILYYNPTVLEIEQELWKSFQTFVQGSKRKQEKIKRLLLDAFSYGLEYIMKTKEITSQEIEEFFIEKAIENFRGFLF